MAHGRAHQHKALFSTGKIRFNTLSPFYKPQGSFECHHQAQLAEACCWTSSRTVIKTQAAQHKTQNGGLDLTYEQYCSLLSSAAQKYDGCLVRSVKTVPSAARRSIYYLLYTKFEPCGIEDEFFDVAYDIDTNPNEILEANVHGFGGPRLNADQWGCLPKERTGEMGPARPSKQVHQSQTQAQPPPQEVLCKVPLGATLESPLKALLSPGTTQLILQSAYMTSVRHSTLPTPIR
jgi:hypothetical protein